MSDRAARLFKAILSSVAAGLVLGCGPSTSVEGPLIVNEDDSPEGMAAEVRGRVDLAAGCLTVDGKPAIWPKGTGWDDEAKELLTPDGDPVALGDIVSGDGGYLSLGDVQGDLGEDALALLHDCGADTEIAVFNGASELTISSD